jgi:hypothetical protein
VSRFNLANQVCDGIGGSSMDTFSLNNYEIKFSSVITVPEIGELFKAHLASEYNIDGFEFVLKARAIKDNSDAIENIINQYIRHKSKQELNLSSSTRLTLEEQYDLFQKSEISLADMIAQLEIVCKIVFLELKADPFPRFIRSPQFVKVAPQFAKNSAVMVLKATKNFKFTRKDFQIPAFTRKDLALGKYLLSEIYDWKSSFSKPGINCYYSTLQVFPEIEYMKGSTLMKVECILPFSYDNALMVHSSAEAAALTNKSVEKVDVKYIVSKDLGVEDVMDSFDAILVKTYTNMFYPLNMRRFDTVGGISMDEDGIYIQFKPYEFEPDKNEFTKKGSHDWNGKKRTMYITPAWGIAMLTKIDEYKTLHTEVICTQIGGWLGGELTRSLTYKFAMEKFSSDIYVRYGCFNEKFLSKDKKLTDYREMLEKNQDQGKLLAKIFFSNENEEKITKI